jgi:hypothetical protein
VPFGGMTTTPGANATATAANVVQGTFDFNVRQAACDHQIHLERYQVNPADLRTLQLVADTSLNMRAPINGISYVQLYIGGALVSPTDPNYGYQILRDPTRLDDPSGLFYKIVFNQEVRLVRPLIEVNYMTRLGYCLKCSGLGVLNDLKQATSGSLIRVINTEKLIQRVLKFVLTSRCVFYPSFTCPIKDYIGRKFGVNITTEEIASAVLTSLTNLQQIQVAQNAIQSLSPEETLQDVTNVTATQDAVDPTVVHVSATIVSYTKQGLNTLVTTPVNFTLQVNN